MAANDAAFVGNIPRHYDQGLGPEIFSDYATVMAARVATTNPARVLETAAGTGIVTRVLRARLPKGTFLTATDLNAPMLEIAKRKFSSTDAKVEFQPADAQALPFPDGGFDAVVCQFGIMFFPDKPKALQEALRVLKPGGLFHLSVWDSHHYNPFARIAHETVSEFLPSDPPQFYKVPMSCSAIDPVKEALIAAGFTAIEISVVPVLKEIEDIARFARAIVFGNPLSEQVQQRGGDPERLAGAILDRLHAAFGKSPSRMPLQAIFYTAQKP